MKLRSMLKLFCGILSIMTGMLLFQSCSDDDGYSLDKFAIEVMTAKPLGGGSYYLVRDNGETLWPFATNDYRFNPNSKQRVQVNYTMLSDSTQGFSHGIKINWIDEILTKAIASNKGDENDEIYGTDPVKLIAIETGGGFLDIMFGAYYGDSGEKHFVNLIPSTIDGLTSYELEFRHNAYNDSQKYGAKGLVSFDLSSLPDTNGKTVTLKIKFNTFDGEVIKEIPYNSSKYSYSGSILTSSLSDKNSEKMF